MKNAFDKYNNIVASIPDEVRREGDLEFALSNRIYELMCKRGLSKVQFAAELGRRPCEVTKWLSGQHNFTLRTIAMLSSFFGETLISIKK